MGTLEGMDDSQIVAQRLDSTERKPIARGTDARYVTTGHVLFARRGVMFAIPFDVERLEPRGAAVPVLEGVLRTRALPTAGPFRRLGERNDRLYARPGFGGFGLRSARADRSIGKTASPSDVGRDV